MNVRFSTTLKRWASPLVLVSLAWPLLATGCHHKSEPGGPSIPDGEAWLTDQQVKDAKLTISPVTPQDVGGAVVASGRITFDDLTVAHVFSPVTGRVVRIEANPGDKVKKGAALAVIESPDVGTAFSDLAKAQADLTAADHDFKRQKELFTAHAGSQRDYETAEDNYGKARAELERAQKKAQLFRGGTVDKVSQEYTLRAPIDGEVIARNANPGIEVQGQYSGGATLELFTIGEVDHVWVMADVFEVDLGRVKVGARVNVQVVAYPKEKFEGQVDLVYGSLDPNTRTAKVKCIIANPHHELRPEMYATVAISVAERRALAVPRNAILRLGDQTVVFVENGRSPSNLVRFVRTPISVDEDEGGEYLPIKSEKPTQGDLVVTSGGILLSGMM